MGEILFSICIGAVISATGLAMLIMLNREEKKVCKKNEDDLR